MPDISGALYWPVHDAIVLHVGHELTMEDRQKLMDLLKAFVEAL
jgi:hypothetical protein